MDAKLTRMTHKIAIQLHLVAESCTICSSRTRRPVLKLLDTPSYKHNVFHSARDPFLLGPATFEYVVFKHLVDTLKMKGET
jgi:hypothetical protein